MHHQKGRAVHQFHAGSAYGDAVTNSLLLTRELLRSLGFRSEIYVQHVAPELAGELHPHTGYAPSAQDTFLVHHSHGHDCADWVMGLRGKNVLVYHNITPAQFLPRGSSVARYAELGRRQLEQFRPHMAAAIADSDYNAAELRVLGYPNPLTLPLLVDPDRLREAAWSRSVGQDLEDAFVVLFVGRIVRNKCQHDLVEAFNVFARRADRRTALVLIGGHEPDDPYFTRLALRVEDLGLGGQIRFAGKVPQDELLAWYRRADAFVCLSEHEGFGVPLVETMAFDVPVIAYDSSAVAGTLGGAGILMKTKKPDEIAAQLEAIASDRALRRALVHRQRERVRELSRPAMLERLGALLTELGVEPLAPRPPVAPAPRRAAWQIEGPFETSYSLALVNREMARALEAQMPGDVALFPTEGPGDYQPKPEDLAKLPELAPLWERGRKGAQPGVVVRGLYPPRVHDADGLVNVLVFGWEESRIRPEWVTAFNRHLDGIAAMSSYVKKALVDSGVRVPISVVGIGVDHVVSVERERFEGELGRGFKFLHVSSAFPRKGVDVLLRAYGQAFRAADPVTLVLKTFPNIHNEVERQLAEARAADSKYPHVQLINRDLPAGQIVDLYRRCDAVVVPSRGEGFGLPMAEGMLFDLPVIATAAGGHADFCTEETAWLVDFAPALARTHFGLSDSVWFEPSAEDLARAMRAVYAAPPEERRRRAKAGKERLLSELTWSAAAKRLRRFVEEIGARPAPARAPRKIAWVSSWNSRCGIAAYSGFLLREMSRSDFEVTVYANKGAEPLEPEGDDVVRCWMDAWTPSLDELRDALAARQPELAVFQFNFGFFPLPAWGRLLDELRDRGVRTVVTFHATRDVDKPDFKASLGTIRDSLARCDRLLVHGVRDLEQLKRFGLSENVTLFPQGVIEPSDRELAATRRAVGFAEDEDVIATFGFLLPHKGTLEIIDAFPRVLAKRPRARLLLVNALYSPAASGELQSRCQARIRELGLDARVTMINDYLAEAEALCLLECADLLVYPYQQTEESSSAALRLGLAARRPVAVTPLSIFEDVGAAVHRLPGVKPKELAAGILELLADPARRASTAGPQRAWLEDHAWAALARRLGGMMQGILEDARERGTP